MRGSRCGASKKSVSVPPTLHGREVDGRLQRSTRTGTARSPLTIVVRAPRIDPVPEALVRVEVRRPGSRRPRGPSRPGAWAVTRPTRAGSQDDATAVARRDREERVGSSSPRWGSSEPGRHLGPRRGSSGEGTTGLGSAHRYVASTYGPPSPRPFVRRTHFGHPFAGTRTHATEHDSVAHVPPFTPDPRLFPFESRWLRRARVGEGALYRRGRRATRSSSSTATRRGASCTAAIVIRLKDSASAASRSTYPGFGLSERPHDYGYTPAEHAGVVAGSRAAS